MNTSKDIIDIIKNRRKELHISQRELARLTGLNNSTISRYESYDRDFPINDLPEFAKALHLDINYLLGVKTADDIDLDTIPGIIPLHKSRRIPILGTIACGEPIFAEENYDGYFMLDASMKHADFILKAQGESMIEANIHDGDLVFLRKTSDVENGAIAAVLIDNEATLKRFNKSDHTIILQPCNKNYAPIIVDENDNKAVLILGEMVGVYTTRHK